MLCSLLLVWDTPMFGGLTSCAYVSGSGRWTSIKELEGGRLLSIDATFRQSELQEHSGSFGKLQAWSFCDIKLAVH